MKSMKNVRIEVNPDIGDEQLFSFYKRNYICEVGYGRELACKHLSNSSLIVGAFDGNRLVGIARAMFDGLSAVIMEFCLELKYQGRNVEYKNGSLIRKDNAGLGKRVGETLINEIITMGANFISCDIIEEYEGDFYRSLGFQPNTGQAVYYIDKRPYRNDERYITRRRSNII